AAQVLEEARNVGLDYVHPEWAAQEGGAIAEEHGGGGEVDFHDPAGRVETEVSDRGEVVKMSVAVAGDFQFKLGPAQAVQAGPQNLALGSVLSHWGVEQPGTAA